MIGYCCFFTCLYVFCVYLSSSNLDRNDTKVIQRRIAGVTVASLVCITSTAFVTQLKWSEVLGIKSSAVEFLSNIFYPLLLTSVLFMGPIVLKFWPSQSRRGSDSGWLSYQDLEAGSLWIAIRNYLAAPISEEIVFRCCMITLLSSHWSKLKLIFLSPLLFGVAHFHHLIEMCWFGEETFLFALIQCGVQFGFTSIFGAMSAFIFLRTDSILSCVFVHAYCNWLGPPSIDWYYESSLQRNGSVFRLCIGLAHILGLILWCFLLYPLTSPILHGNDRFSFLWR